MSSVDSNWSNLKQTRSIFVKGLIGFFIVGLVLLGLDRLANISILGDNGHNGHISLTSHIRKNGNRQHILVSRLVSDGASESVVSSMANFFNKMYTGELLIGTPSQSFKHIVFDTGSADLWVMSESAKGNGVPSKSYLNYYDSDESSSYSTDSNNIWSITYGTGQASGESGFETIKIGSMTANNQIFAIADSITDMSISEYEPQDGICGFARNAASNLKDGTPIMETLYNNGINTNGYFSFYLSQHGDSGSKLIVGDSAINNNYFEGNLNWVDISEDSGYQVPGLWTVKMDSFIVGKEHDNDKYSISSQYGIVDTGTTYIGIPYNYYNDVMNWITSNRNDCSKESNSDSAIYLCTDTMNPYKNLPNVYFNFLDTNGNNLELILTPKQYVDDDGQLGFMSLSLDVWIFGDTFLKNYYSVFDDNNSRIGFATAKSHDNQLSALMKSILIISIIVVSILLILSCLRWYVTKKQSRYFSNQSGLLLPSNSVNAANAANGANAAANGFNGDASNAEN